MSLEPDSMDELTWPCPSCSQPQFYGARTAALPDMQCRGVTEVFGTRCFACGDVRLYAKAEDPDQRAEVRADLDDFAAFLTRVCCQESGNAGRH